MSKAQLLRGIANVSFWAADLTAARQWYTELLGIEPYFQRPATGPPAYLEFRLGDYQQELGIIDSRFAPDDSSGGPAGAVVYWHVDNVTASIERLRSMGAKEHEAPVDRGQGFVTASVLDPFGNILGIMHNPHYLAVLASATQA